MYKHQLALYFLLLVLFTAKQVRCAENNATEDIKPTYKTIYIKDTELCKKCNCDKETATLDCNNRNITNWLTSDELTALLNDTEYNFENINFENNHLSEIPELPSLIKVKSLNFRNNKISKISNGAFTKLSSLKKLDFSNNLLTTKNLNSEVFKGKYNPHLYEPMTNLTDLNLSGNQLHSLQQDIFSHFPRIEILNLSSNNFQHIDDLSSVAISSLGYIMEIDLSYMELTDLPKYLFNYHKTDIKIVMLDGNKFNKIPYESIGKAVNLEKLYLNNNPFTQFDEDNKFPILPNLKELYISNCPNLTSIGPTTFSGLKNLTKLFISNNPGLKLIHANSLAYYQEHSLELSFPPLEWLNLSNNSIEVFPATLLENWHLLQKIDLSNNPWTCTCKNDFLINRLLKQIQKKTPNLLENVICKTPEESQGLSLEKIGNISCNYPESSSANNYTVVTGMIIGILMSIPLAYLVFIIYKRGCFGFGNKFNPAGFSRAFYSRTNNDEFM